MVDPSKGNQLPLWWVLPNQIVQSLDQNIIDSNLPASTGVRSPLSSRNVMRAVDFIRLTSPFGFFILRRYFNSHGCRIQKEQQRFLWVLFNTIHRCSSYVIVKNEVKDIQNSLIWILCWIERYMPIVFLTFTLHILTHWSLVVTNHGPLYVTWTFAEERYYGLMCHSVFVSHFCCDWLTIH